MPSEYRRIGLTLTPDLARSLRVLGLDPEPAPGSGHEPAGAWQITPALHRYAAAVALASRELQGLLTREEWNFIADVCNGSGPLEDASPDVPFLAMAIANVADGQRLDGTGDKWFGNGQGDKGTRALLAKLQKLSHLHGDAILAAVRYFWDHTSIDHTRTKWWTVEARAPREERLA